MNDIKSSFPWAKLEKNKFGEVVNQHHLLAHSADVASVLEALLKHSILNQRIAKLAGWEELNDIQIARLSFLAAIHDAGKANIGFQNKINAQPPFVAGHVKPMLDLLNADSDVQKELLLPLGIGDIMDWFEDDDVSSNLTEFLCATWSHHGKPVQPGYDYRSRYWKPDNDKDPVKILRSLGDEAKRWFVDAFDCNARTFPSNHAFIHGFNGLLTLADWIGSDTRFFDYADYTDTYIAEARNRAAFAVSTLFLNPEPSRSYIKTLEVDFPLFCNFPPYPIQSLCLKAPIYSAGSISILESDTGSGKTESAIARFLYLYKHGMVDGMYFAVPTRSAATQLYERVREAVARAFSDTTKRPPVVQAVSGYIKVDGLDGIPLPHFQVLWPDEKNSHFEERAWAGESPKRYLAGAVVIGTIDQVLLSGLALKHAHMRATALLRLLLVVDEVHSSDFYMTRLLQRVLDFHLQAGGHAMLMSATLGSAARLKLLKADSSDIPDFKTAVGVPYPLLSHRDGSKPGIATETGHSSGFQKKVHMETKTFAASYDEVALLAVEFAAQGARVLIIRNLVKDCVHTQRVVENTTGVTPQILFSVDGRAAPHHSRYAPDDRKLLDKRIEACFGKNSPSRGLIATATQTVEQSLDIDADILITDLCPIDVLLQRLGRLHRHKRTRPEAFRQAQCIVLTPENRDLSTSITSNGTGNKGKHGLGTVYNDLRMLEASWRLLEKKEAPIWNIPVDNRLLVESGTHPEVLDAIVNELGNKWLMHRQAMEGQLFAQQQIFGISSYDFDLPFSETSFSSDFGNPKTRLGTNDFKVLLPSYPVGPFSQPVGEVTLSARNFGDNLPENLVIPEDDIQQTDGGFSFTLAGKAFTYNRHGLALQS